MKTKQLLTFLEHKGLISEDDNFSIMSGIDSDIIPLTGRNLLILKDCTMEEGEIFVGRLRLIFQDITPLIILDDENIFRVLIKDFNKYSFKGKFILLFDGRKGMRHEALPYSFESVNKTVYTLLAPGGCPWDRSQNHQSMRTYLLQEAFEVIDAIDKNDMSNLKEELGDVLFQIVFHSALAEKEGFFTMQDVIDGISDKMIKRHPFVFQKEDKNAYATSYEAWEKRKRIEKNRKYLLSGVPKGLPSLLLTCIIQKKVSSSGLQNLLPTEDYMDVSREAFHAIKLKSVEPGDKENEAGALLFRLAWLLRNQGIEPELALRRFTIDFMDRLQGFEDRLEENGLHLSDVAPEKLLQLWNDYLQADN